MYKLELIALAGDDNNEKIVKLNLMMHSVEYIKEVQKFLVEKVLGSMNGYLASINVGQK